MRALLPIFALFFCACGPSTPSPCAAERFKCSESTEGFQILPGCTLADPLQVEIGYGQGSFTPLQPNGALPVYLGIQGGQHTYLAVRIANPALDRYDKLEVHFLVTSVEPIPCDAWNARAAADAASGDAGGDITGSEGTCVRRYGERTVLLGKGAKLKVDAKGAVVETGLVVFLDSWPNNEPLRIDLTVRDPCGRVATSQVVAIP